MATTQNGIYYPNDGTKSADILADMKEMAESIDGIIEEEKETTEQTIQEIQETQATQNQKIQELDDNQIHVTTEKSNNINIQDASGQNAKINVFGISKQETRSGKNMLAVINTSVTTKGVTITNNENGSLTLNGTATANIYYNLNITNNTKKYFKLINGNTYGILLKNRVNGTSLVVRSETKNNALLSLTDAEEKTMKYNYETDEQCYAYMQINSGTVLNNTILYPMLVEGAEIGEWEQYGTSPSPGYPSEIENTGDNINLFDKETITDNNYLNENGGLTANTLYCVSDFISVEENETYFLPERGTARTKFYDKNKQALTSTWDVADGDKSFVIPKNAKYIRISINKNVVDINKFKFEKGTEATAYSKYKYGSIQVTKCNKNMFNIDEFKDFFDLTETGTDGGHDYIAYTTKSYINNKFMRGKFKANTQYTISFLGRQKQAGQGQTSGFVFNYTDGTNSIKYINNNEIWTEYTLTSDKNKTIDYISMAWAYGGTVWLSDIQLEVNNVATDYIENEQQTITFPLVQNQKMYEGSETKSDGIHHVRNQVELTGNENITIFNYGTAHINTTIFKFEKLIIKKNNALKYCSHFKVLLNLVETLNTDDNWIMNDGDGNVFICIKNDIASTVDEIKLYLSQQKNNGTPVIFEYELLEEEIEPYTPEQQEAYNKLQNVLPYKLVTNIFTDLALLKFNYIADTKTYIDNKTTNIQNQLNTINQLLSTTGTSALLLDNMQSDLESEVL